MTRINKQNIKRVATEPGLLKNELLRTVNNPAELTNNAIRYPTFRDGIDIVKQDWDNLIILDACRFDAFKKTNSIDGELQAVKSQASTSHKFVRKNFAGRKLHDTICITANPFYRNVDNNVFYIMKSVLSEWDEESGTVHPDDVLEFTTSLYKEYRDKKFIVHLMQPHFPYFGKTADELRESIDFQGWNREANKAGTDFDTDGIKWINAVKEDKISLQDLKQAYIETLEFILEYVRDLLELLDGKSVITSDHGELLGERLWPYSSRRYGHPRDLLTPELRKVPWFEPDFKSRRNVVAEEPIQDERLADEKIRERLESLGYK